MLNDTEKDILQSLLTNENLLKVIHKVFLDTIELNRPTIGDVDNTLLGEKYRSYEFSKGVVDAGFKDLLSYKIHSKDKEVLNRAR